jgi:hypothetical protein
MMKKTSQTLLLVFSSLLLLISVTVCVRAQGPGRRPLTYTVSGQIRWKKEYGVIPMGPGNSKASVYPCSPFFVAAINPGSGKAIAYTENALTQGADDGEYYVCNYSMKVPADTSLYITAGLGGVLLLPKMDRSPYYITAPWIGGSRPQPPGGAERSFTGFKYVTLSGRRTRAVVSFEMIYARNDDPK